EIIVHGTGFGQFQQPKTAIDIGNSGTTIRLAMGILAGSEQSVTLYGDDSIAKRPMNRVMLPLKEMGVTCSGKDQTEFPPISIQGNPELQPIHYQLPVASAQVKSALILAALQAEGE